MTLNKLKSQIMRNTGLKIDFRSDAHIANYYGCTPVMDYRKAEKIVSEAITILGLYITTVNTKMILNSMQICSLKNELENLIFISKGSENEL